MNPYSEEDEKRPAPWRQYSLDRLYTISDPHSLRHAASSIDNTPQIETHVWSDDQPQRVLPGLQHTLFGPEREEERRRAHVGVRWWMPEVLSQVGGLCCLLGIVILLWQYDGKLAPTMYAGLTLNTVLAFLTSLAKVAFLVPIVEGLGQLKWMWFLSRTPKPLHDMQVFDEATRGGLGGVKLFLGFKGFLPSFGALIMLSGLFTSTLMQQAIRYEVIAAESHSAEDVAMVDRATTFSTYDGDRLVIAPYDTAREQQAVFQGAFAPPNETIPHVRPTCSSSKCTWPNYGSLAICGDVANLTALGDQSLLERLGNATEKRLAVLFNTSRATSEALGYGGSYFTAVPKVFPIVMGLLDRPTNAFNKSVTDLMLIDTFVAYTNELLNNSATFDMSKIKYLEVALWWCTKTYSTEVMAGNATTVEISTTSQLKEPASAPLNMPWALGFYTCYTAGTCNTTYGGSVASLEPPPGTSGPESYTIHIWTELTASALLAATMFDSVFMDRTRGVVSSNGGGIAKAFGLSILGDFLSTSSPPPEVQMANTRALIANIARSTTNLVRQGNTRLPLPPSSPSLPSLSLVPGKVYTPQSFITIHWEWTSMLAVQLALTLIFLVLTIYTTHQAQMQVIKCSSLATLCALDKGARGHVGGINDLDSLGKKARMVGVRLERGSGGVAVWLGMGRR